MSNFLSAKWWAGVGVLVTIAGLVYTIMAHDGAATRNEIGPNSTCNAQGDHNTVNC